MHDGDKVTREDVFAQFLKILGRLPESEEVVQAHLQLPNFRTLIDALLTSEEFGARVKPPPRHTGRIFHPIEAAHNHVDTHVTAEQLQLCLARVKAQWHALGESRPHFSVLTDERYEPDRVHQHLETFHRSGHDDVAVVLALARRHGLVEFKHVHANELGCGVGRLTVPLAAAFGSVTGYDISPPHLSLAREYANERGVNNIALEEVVVGTLPTFQPCDLFYSRIVLQHNPPTLIRHLVRAMLAALKPQGLAIFQVPSYIVGYRFSLEEWIRDPGGASMEMHALPVRHVLEEAGALDCVPLEVREDDVGSNQITSQTYVLQKR